MDFVHLHLHTEYSLLDGACVMKRLVKRLHELGQTAVAITDHGNMYGAVEFYKTCKAEGIKPIIGCEVYMANRSRFDKVHRLDGSNHLILLCKNATGYQNLIKLVSAGFTEGFYNKPRIDKALLEQYSEGLICLSACLAGEIPQALSAQDYAGAVKIAKYYKNLFGEDFYLELQDHDMEEQKRILPLLSRLAKELDIGLVCTNDCHYLTREDAKAQAVLMCIQTNTVYGEEKALELPTEEFYVKSGEEMAARFSAYPEALENTLRIAEKCNFDFEFGVTKLPYFVIPGVEDNVAYFRELCHAGLRKRYEQITPELVERLEYELSVITRMGYVNYYLIVWDFIRYAREHDIPVGPGRGSGAGSLCAYTIGITGIDPMRYGLLFERFLNPERVSMPDFDVDFCFEKRQQVIDYVVQKYGSDHVAQIITFGTMAAKAAVRDVGRALGRNYQEVDRIAKLIPGELNITIEKALKTAPELKTLYENDPAAAELLDMAQKLEGMPRHASTHAAGVVITREAVDYYVPLQKNDEAVVTQYTMTTLEELGLLKMDFLGLRNLTVIDQCEKAIQKKNPGFSVAAQPFDDPAVYRLFSDADTQGVFQMESPGMKRVLSQLKPESLEDIIAVISLYRPGPMDSIPRYIKNRHDPSGITYRHPLLKPILEVTYGCIVYQEQVMQICRQLAGYSYGRADLVRRAMSKKKAAVMEQERQYFIYGKKNEDGSVECPGAVANGVPAEVANAIFDEMSSFAAYAFNKSHAAAYAVVAYRTAYLKCHYPREYMAALLTSVLGNTDKIIEYITAAEEKGIRVDAPDINRSELGFTVSEDGHLRFGLLAVKNLGRSAIEAIIRERTLNGRFASLGDFLKRMRGGEVNKRAVESLIKCGAFDGLTHNRREMLSGYEGLIDAVESSARRNVEGQLDLFGLTQRPEAELTLPGMADFTLKEKLQLEKDSVGMYLSGHPLDEVQLPERMGKITSIADILAEDAAEHGLGDGATVRILCIVQNKKLFVTKKQATMAFLTVEDKNAAMEVVVFAAYYAGNAALFAADTPLVITGKLSLREDEPPKLLCESAVDCRNLQSVRAPGKLYLRFPDAASPLVAQAATLLEQTPGKDKVFYYFTDTKKYSEWGTACADKPLLEMLSTLLSSENVVLK